MFGLSIVLSAGLNLIQPAGGEYLLRGSTFTIRWTAPPNEGEQKVDIYLGDKLIADTSKKKDGSYLWTVGKLKNGTWVPAGQYSIVLESLDGDAFGNKFNIFVYIPWLTKLSKIIMIPVPSQCPQCANLDLRELKKLSRPVKGSFQLKLYRNNRMLVNLGTIGGRRGVPDFAKIKLPLMRRLKSKAKYELKVFHHNGKLMESQPIQLVRRSRK